MNAPIDQERSEKCPFCGQAIRAEEGFRLGMLRFDHVLDHALLSALQTRSWCLGDAQFFDAAERADPESWPEAIDLARDCLSGQLGEHINTMYRVAGKLGERGALGKLRLDEIAREFHWKRPVERLSAELELLAAGLR